MKIIAIVIVLLMLVSTAQASYIPKEYKNEADKTVKNDVTLYTFAVKHFGDVNGIMNWWAYDILRQLAQNYTNSGEISELHIIMKDKFGVRV